MGCGESWRTSCESLRPRRAQKLAEGWTYVDVRTTQEFEAGHPAGALNVPIAHREGPNPDFLRVMKANFPLDAKIVVGCKTRRAERSARRRRSSPRGSRTSSTSAPAGTGRATRSARSPRRGWRPAGLPREDGAPAGPQLGGPAEQGLRRSFGAPPLAQPCPGTGLDRPRTSVEPERPAEPSLAGGSLARSADSSAS